MTQNRDEEIARMAPNRLFEMALRKYYRRVPPVPVADLLRRIRRKPVSIQEKIARNCSYPQVVEALLESGRQTVDRAARQNPYWQLIGQYRALLGLRRDQKIKFIRRESFANLLVFAICETDLKVLRELFLHPDFSVQMLYVFQTYLVKRSAHTDVEPVLRLLQQTFTLRRRRIFKVTEIFQEARQEDAEQSIERILPYLLDEDEVVIRSAVNVLKKFNYADLRKILFREHPFPNSFNDSHRIWQLLENLKTYYRLPGAPLVEPDTPALKRTETQEHFLADIQRRKKNLLHHCGNHLDQFSSILTLALACLDPDPEIQEQVTGIITIPELLTLVADPSFPRAVSYQVLNILRLHPSPAVHKSLSDIFLEINERTRRELREMELSVNAYFDIIFNSLGYPRIRQIRQAFKVLEAAKKLTGSFLDQSQKENLNFEEVFRLFGKIAEFYQGKLTDIYFNLDDNLLEELREVFEIVQLLLQLPREQVGAYGYRREDDPATFAQILHRTRTVWRATLGQYLGRLKELDEMIRRKWLHTIADRPARQKLQRDMQTAIAQLEADYKEEMNCRLTRTCRDCRKRPCAAERYLRQVEFFLGEMLDEMDDETDLTQDEPRQGVA